MYGSVYVPLNVNFIFYLSTLIVENYVNLGIIDFNRGKNRLLKLILPRLKSIFSKFKVDSSKFKVVFSKFKVDYSKFKVDFSEFKVDFSMIKVDK